MWSSKMRPLVLLTTIGLPKEIANPSDQRFVSGRLVPVVLCAIPFELRGPVAVFPVVARRLIRSPCRLLSAQSRGIEER